MSGRSLADFAGLAASVLALLVVVSVGLIIARHQRRNPIGWLLLGISVAVVGFQVCQAISSHNKVSHPWLAVAFEVLTQLLYFGFLFATPLILLFFPEGRLPSAQWRKVVIAYGACVSLVVVFVVASLLAPIWGEARPNIGPNGSSGGPGPVWAQLGFNGLVLVCLGLAISWLVARVRSYRRSSGAVRQQYRWLALGATSMLLGLIVSFVTPTGHSTLIDVERFFTTLAIIPFPVSIGVAILKYRLYDINRVVSRTLSYALLTASLVGLYICTVALSTQLLPFSSSFGAAASTLTAVALFTPLRRRLQRMVDRRFNRRRYNAEATAADFALVLRSAVDPSVVESELLAALETAIEPQHMSLWLAPLLTHT